MHVIGIICNLLFHERNAHTHPTLLLSFYAAYNTDAHSLYRCAWLCFFGGKFSVNSVKVCTLPFFLIYFFLPTSARWLYSKNRNAEG